MQQIQPYLFFDGNCGEAVAFYQRALGAEVTELMRFKDVPDMWEGGAPPPGSEDKILHVSFTVGEAMIMASDDPRGHPRFDGFALSLAVADAAEGERLFRALGEGGEVRMPLEETFWSPLFGMVADRFGVVWMINTLPAQS